MRASIVSAAFFAVCAHAIAISAPIKDQVIDISAGFKVQWTTVSTDPTKAHLFLVNQAGGHTPYSKDLGEVDLTKGSVTVTQDGVPNDTGYQFNLQSVQTLNTGILAQSQQFEIKANKKNTTTSSSDSSMVSTTMSKSSTTASATTLTISTASSTITGTGTSANASSKASGSAVPTAAADAVRGSSLLALVVGLFAVVA